MAMGAAEVVSPVADPVRQALVWGGVLLAAVIVLFGGLWYYRRRWLGQRPRETTQAWGLDDLRRMRDEGQITEEEYRALRATVAASYQGGAEGPASRDATASRPRAAEGGRRGGA